MEFLEKEFLGLALSYYVRGIIILSIGFLFKGIISKLLGKIAYKFIANKEDKHASNSFALHIKRPLSNFVFVVIAYFAMMQIAPLLDSIWLFKRTIKPNTGNALLVNTEEILKLKKFSLLDLTESIFFLIQIFTFTGLVIKVLNYYFMVRLQKVTAKNDKERQQLYPLLRDVLRVFVWTIMSFVILGVVFKVNVAALIAGLGVGGIAIAFALKDSLENLLSSFMILLDKPFIIGDLIKINDVLGNVERVGFRSTLIRTFDKTVVSIPNKSLISNNLENFSQRGVIRVKMTVGAEYGLSKEQLKNIMSAINDLILNTPGTANTPIINLNDFGESSININIIYFIQIPIIDSLENIKENVNFGIYEIMYKIGTGFPYPTQSQVQSTPFNNVSSAKGDS
ncbi:MAG TPA: mechanosensitive ion channel family protein [Edaphocola sp.]|nr:mechanosensitive ion channel family protein [Edaphocola sp.]